MIPLQLTITNFLSYRETVNLDLREVHLACISGLNGAGKSTILDGITWALFGKSRGSNDDVVNRIAAGNGKAAEVQYIFELEGAVYRVTRRKAVGKTTELELHLRVHEDEIGGWRALTEAKIHETENTIRDLLRMNYDIFTNASFLLQGAADEFTTKTPDKRKQILAEILGVSQWENYKAQAAEKRKESEAEVQNITLRLKDIEIELSEETQRRETLQSAEAQEAKLKDRLEAQEKLRTQMGQTKILADQMRRRLERLLADYRKLELDQEHLQSEHASRQVELDQYQLIIAQQAVIEQRFADWTAAEAELAAWQQKADVFNQIVAERHPHEMAIASERAALQQKQRQLQTQADQVNELVLEREHLVAQLAADRAKLESLVSEISRKTDERQAWETVRAELLQLESDQRFYQQEQMQLLERRAEVDRLRAERPAIVQNAQSARDRLAQLLAELTRVSDFEQLLAGKHAEKSTLQSEQERLRQIMDERRDRIDQLEKDWAKMRDQTQPACPLCGQELTVEHQTDVLAQLRAEGKEWGDRFRLNKSRIKELEEETKDLAEKKQRRPVLEAERDDQQKRLAQAEARIREIDTAIASWESGAGPGKLAQLSTLLVEPEKINTLKTRVAELALAVQQLSQLDKERQETQTAVITAEARLQQIDGLLQEWEESGRRRLATVLQQLAGDEYAPEARSALREIDSRLAAVEYDQAAHQVARERRANLADAAEQHQRLRSAEAAVKPLSDSLADLNKRLRSNGDQLVELEKEKREIESSLSEAETATTGWQALEVEVTRLRDEVAEAGRSVGAARQRVEVLESLRQSAVGQIEKRRIAQHRVALLKEIEEACGRQGVQALLIEHALPEIEDHANDLLERLTGGEMRVKFETQRELKTGSQKETLDIKISDSTGERSYESYSGGEKFRVNFAVRLALSQVLAKRAGARLRMLVIDEGFGSQDQEGRQRLVEAINTVQSDFACILVITHIDELRDKFPVRIDVEKTILGSQVNMIAI